MAEYLDGARVVKAFNTFTPGLLTANPHEAGGRRVMFYAGNDEPAKLTVSGIIDKIGFAGVDLGRLNDGGKLLNYPGGPLLTLNMIMLNKM